MTVAVVTLAVALAAALGAVVYLAYRHADALRSERASMADANLARTELLDQKRQRQSWEERAVKAAAELAEAKQKLAKAQADADRARAELTAQIKSRLENGTDEQAAAIVNDLLGTHILPPKES